MFGEDIYKYIVTGWWSLPTTYTERVFERGNKYLQRIHCGWVAESPDHPMTCAERAFVEWSSEDICREYIVTGWRKTQSNSTEITGSVLF